MGNKLSRRRQVVDERYTKPQGLYQHKDVDHKKLRKLILDSKLAPCYPGDDDSSFDLEECPICFLYYPSLNRSRCCAKGICTECFLQMKPPHSTRPTQCPFCKTCNYAVEYRGMRSKEEKGIEQVEEQRVIEAKIRMQQQEIHNNEEERTQRRLETSTASRIITADEVGYTGLSTTSQAVRSFNFPVENDEIVTCHEAQSAHLSRQPSRLRMNRDDQYEVDLEDLMVMEAIWLSIQENDTRRLLTCGDENASEDDCASSAIATTSSPSRGLACAIATLAERQHMAPGPSSDMDTTGSSGLGPAESWADSREEGEWGTDVGSEVAEAGTSYDSSDPTSDLHGPGPGPIVPVPGSILPDSFEEQMMLAMAVSLADARARTNSQGVTWN
ncbi:hypothetical protein ACHQM5_004461 [Ranunculus cassubicifolius]